MNANIAVCIPTYNQAQFLGQAVESALRQHGALGHIWVGDDASTDATPDVMRQFAAEPRVLYHRHQRNLGIAGNNNWLLDQPESEFIVRLDSDDLLAPDYVMALAAELLRHPGAGYAHAAVHEIDRAGHFTRDRLLARKPGYQTPEDSLRAMASGYRVAANICMFRRSALRAVGFYREGLNFAEDWDMAVRLADAGWGNVYCNRLLASYRDWTDAGVVRAHRKRAEIDGCRRTFLESIEPAFKRRGWPTGTLIRRRQALAARHALALANPVFTREEKSAMIVALLALGDGPILRWRLALVRMGLGGLLRRFEILGLRARDAAKGLLRLAASIG
jgi:glycosyltransferase involved in cell wall biosynthesis